MYAKLMIEPALAPAVARPASQWIERRNNVDAPEFQKSYLWPRRPLVLTDALREWQALRVFTPNFFRQRFGNVPVQMGGQSVTLGEAIDLQLAATREKPGPYACTLADCTELLPYVTPRIACSLPSRQAHLPQAAFADTSHVELLFGGPGGALANPQCDMLHRHLWIAQVYGEREVILYEPEQQHRLYVDAQQPWRSTVHDIDDYAEYPLLRRARRHRVVLRPGDALFVPCGTWYATRCLSMGISVVFDQIESGNWRDFIDAAVAVQHRRGHPARAFAYGACLRALGPFLQAAEWFGVGRALDWGHDGSTGWKAARRCPAHRP
jgi:hypothetical protein